MNKEKIVSKKENSPVRCSIHFDYRLAALANADPLHRHIQILLDEAHVVLSVLRQIAEVSDVDGRFLPARQRNVLDLNLRQIGNGAGEVVDDFAVQLVTKMKLFRSVEREGEEVEAYFTATLISLSVSRMSSLVRQIAEYPFTSEVYRKTGRSSQPHRRTRRVVTPISAPRSCRSLPMSYNYQFNRLSSITKSINSR